ncbi:hypothetical protein AALO_G00121510 [Alosa alosa]|uniref:Uncharacterized protein n=2 Tax=Alosa alosa TaxID=278164 RepID=A0AAV6GM54_9TELE|nr:uncharacterized protein LOC125300926 isoform X1 [Alosa alosa]XP_048109060.1 uncharacterized protein LOC125300926 isoform X1 [Alosa alosa]KAG5275544.1 hypothetical protein AALO_G00121510 [Alosa alosa]
MVPLSHLPADQTMCPCTLTARSSASASSNQEPRPVVAVLLMRGVRDDVLLDLERIITESGEHGDENTTHQFTTSVSDNQQEGLRDSPAAQYPDAESRIEFLGWSMPYPKGVRIPDSPDSDRYWDYIQYAEAVDRLNKCLDPGKTCRTCVERLQRIYGIEARLDWSLQLSSDEESVTDDSRFYIRPHADGPVPLYYKRAGRTWHESCSSNEDTSDLTDVERWSEACQRGGEKRERRVSQSPPGASASVSPLSPKRRMLTHWRPADDDSD